MIEAKDLTKIYKIGNVEVKALDGVNLKIERGDFLVIIGPSGSGKSTLLHLLGALDRPTSGKVLIEGKDITKLSDRELSRIRREKVGFVFQFFNLIPTLDALENVIIPLDPIEKDKNKLKNKGRKLLEEVGLGKRINHKPSELSGGERQRVAIARALINDPLIVLADEPTGNIDTQTGMKIVGLMKRLNREKKQTFVIATHDPLIAKGANKIVYLRDGKIIKEVRK